MDLKELQQNWEDLAKKDAMWAVLTGPAGERREWNVEAFFQSGVDEINMILGRLREAGATIGSARALDFGCGVGRLTQALCGHFERADGVDIAASMLDQARKLNRFGERCTYHLNQTDDLSVFPGDTFDFIYSNITLQHMEPRYSRRYIEEFFRIVRPGGAVVFQIPGRLIPTAHAVTRSPDPLPAAAAQASIEPPATKLRCAPGALVPLHVIVRNSGTQLWPALAEDDGSYSVRLGNHWFGRGGWRFSKLHWRLHAFDDARAALQHDVGPGEVVGIGLLVTAPIEPGTYRLELDMVQENVRWFAQAGSPIAQIEVQVDAKLPRDAVEGLPPRMEMHGIPRPEVEALIASCGGVVLAADADDAPGRDWESFRYFSVHS
jgi:SAM-dependent methyltransferase